MSETEFKMRQRLDVLYRIKCEQTWWDDQLANSFWRELYWANREILYPVCPKM